MGAPQALSGPDLAAGVEAASVVEGKPLLGHANGEPVMLVKTGGELFAVSASCPHYSGPLAEGLQVGASVRCPWHHASFDVRTGVSTAPTINPLPCYALTTNGSRVFVGSKRSYPEVPPAKAGPSSVVIVGGGAAGHSAAETLRLNGYQGPVTLISADAHAPYDRPNLSKDYLAGTAPEDWIPLRSSDDYSSRKLVLRTGVRATGIDTTRKNLSLSDGSQLAYDALLLATGAVPIRLPVPGGDSPQVLTLRTLADARALIAELGKVKRVAIIGASFIGLEAASALRSRGLEVSVIGKEAVPMDRIFGADVGAFVQKLHEEAGIQFHLSADVKELRPGEGVQLADRLVEADLILVGVGVRPELELAQQAGLAMASGGVRTDNYLRTSVPGIWAAGDVARWPDPRTGQLARVEHWALAQRQGAIAAQNMLGKNVPFTAAPFFWTVQQGVTFAYVGYAPGWDSKTVDGSFEKRDFCVRYFSSGRLLAALCVGRDRESLEIEAELEKQNAAQR